MAIEEFLPQILAGISIAIGPGIIATLFLYKRNRNVLVPFLFGWGGWFIALLARLVPLQVPALFLAEQLASSTTVMLIYVAYASILAGIFEEGFRYLFLDQRKEIRKKTSSLLSFGLGWGVGEAILLYVPAVLALPFFAETAPSFLEILPGALERNIAITFHLSATLIIFRALSSKGIARKKYLLLAVLAHSILNIVSVYSLVLTRNVWLSESLALLSTSLVALAAYRLFLKKKIF